MRRTFAVSVAFLVVAVTSTVTAGDWPAFRHDLARSGATDESLDAEKLRKVWTYKSTHPPQPAWPGPAKWDAYKNIRGLRSMRDYDRAFHAVIVGKSLFFGSTVDDSLYCLDTSTGKTKWVYTTDGPIRVAPMYSNSRLYFGSDDGHAYCLRAVDGELIWKSAAPAKSPLILNNGRFISQWPCRTGVVVRDGVAWFGLSLLPWKPSYVCAVDAKTGKADDPGRFVKTVSGATFEAAWASLGEILIAPQGRVAPSRIRVTDGQSLGGFEGGGGSFVASTPQQQLVHGPGNRTGWLTVSNVTTGKKTATHQRFISAAITADRRYFISETRLAAFDAKTGRALWEVPVQGGRSVIAAGAHVFVGARDRVVAVTSEDGKRVWSTSLGGAVESMAVADGALFASTDSGAIYCFRPSDQSVETVEHKVDPQKTASTDKPGLTVDGDVDEKGLVDRWVFHSGMEARAKRRGLPDYRQWVANLSGGRSGKIQGKPKLVAVGGVEALELDGSSNSVLITDDHTQAKLPRVAITAEAWVRVDQPLKWGGIIGAVQDNGNDEHGWLLGYSDTKFSFAVAGKKGDGRLTYLASKSDFDRARWHHVVGTYDGKTQRVYVDGELAGEATTQQGEIRYPPKAFYEIGAYHDKDENFRMTGLVHEVRVYNRAISADEVAAHYHAKRKGFPVPIALAFGPFARFTSPDSAEIRWRTDEPSPTVLLYDSEGETQRIEDVTLKTEHVATLSDLPRGPVGRYRIGTVVAGKSGMTSEFELETEFNFSPLAVPKGDVEISKRVTDGAKRTLEVAGVDRGICLLFGCADGRRAYEIARQSHLRVVVVDTDRARIAKTRAWLRKVGVYGVRVAVHHVESYEQLPFINGFANVVTFAETDRLPPVKSRSAAKWLRPDGGVLCVGHLVGRDVDFDKAVLFKWIETSGMKSLVVDEVTGVWAVAKREPLAGAGEWSHLYGTADNSAYGGEQLGGASTAGELDLQWLGRPGPRVQPDRNGRKPSPLSTGGRLFVQGLDRLIALDAYNGTILWSLEIPPLGRFNMPRDSGNWCADRDELFVAIRGECWRIDARTGKLKAVQSVIDAKRADWKYDWGYIARAGDRLLGSAVKQGTAYNDFWGKADAGWYDARSGPATYKVCSDNLFALDAKTGKRVWTYEDGVILQSTLTVAKDRVCFLESRNEEIKAGKDRRIGDEKLWKDQYLVALDLKTGEPIWQAPIDIEDGTVVCYMASGGGKLVVVSSNNKKYDVYAFDQATGQSLWHKSFGWPEGKGDHGKAMSRPAIVGNRVFVRPRVLDLKTGELLPITMPGGGCGTYAATAKSLIFRSSNVTLWNLETGKRSDFNRLRPGCWLSTIPAAGMLLSPEAGGGCSCGKWLETSLGFRPRMATGK